MAYFLQPGGAGREELFTQLFVAMGPGVWPQTTKPNFSRPSRGAGT